jgi:DNA polymerase-1
MQTSEGKAMAEPLKTTGGADIIVITGKRHLQQAALYAKTWDVISLDIETAHDKEVTYNEAGKVQYTRLDYNLLKLRSIQFGNDEVVFVLDCALLPDWQIPEFLDLLTNKDYRKVAHNATFEYRVLALHGVTCENLACTMQAERVLFQGLLMKRPSLAELVQKYVGREMLKDVRDTFIEERYVQPLRPEQIIYAADDVDVLIPIYQQQLTQLAAANLTRVAEFEWAVQRAFGNIMNRGVYLDTTAWREILEENIVLRDQAHAALFESFKPAVIKRWEHLLIEREKERERLLTEIDNTADPVVKERLTLLLDKLPSWLKKKPNKDGAYEPKKSAMWPFDKVLTSPAQLKHAFLQFGVELQDTNERTLQKVRRDWLDHEANLKAAGQPTTDIPYEGLQAIQLLMDHRGLEKRVTGYGENWISAISEVTGLIHADYDTLKDTARTGCSDPNIQNVPKRGDGKKYRRCFPVRPGVDEQYVIGDYSQIELRVAAELSGDPNMIKAFNSGEDIHKATAGFMFNKSHDLSKVTGDERTAAKCVNFGILFGIGAQKLSEQITNSPGAAPCSLQMAKDFLRLYTKSYPRLLKWLADMGQAAKDELQVFTVLGHRRRFNAPIMPNRSEYPTPFAFKEAQDKYRAQLGSIEREGKNTPVQGSAAVIAKWAILDLERKLPEGAEIVLFVHDEIGIRCKTHLVPQVKKIMKECMEGAGQRFMKKVICLVEIEDHGDNWLGEHIVAPSQPEPVIVAGKEKPWNSWDDDYNEWRDPLDIHMDMIRKIPEGA